MLFAQGQGAQKPQQPVEPPPEPFTIERLTTGLIPYQVGPLSPDGKHLLVLTKKDREGPLLMSLDLASRALTSLVDLPGGVYQPRWSPRGDAVVMSGSDGKPFPDIYLYKFEGAVLQRLTSAETAEREPAFMPSGDRIVFTSEAPKVAGAAFGEKHPLMLALNQSKPAPLMNEDLVALHPEPLPGGDRILLVLVSPETGRHRLVEVSAKGEVIRELGSGEVSFIQSVTVSSDGALAILEAQHRTQSPVSVYLVDLSDGSMTEIGGEKDRTFGPALSPDGKRIVYSEESHRMIHLSLQSLDSDERQQLTLLGGANWGAVWLDRDRIAFASDRQGESDIYVIRLDKPAPPPENEGRIKREVIASASAREHRTGPGRIEPRRQQTMYCPKCGGVAAEEQKFCKLCGSNLQVVSDALHGSSLGTDLEALKRNLKELGRNLASELRVENRPRVYGLSVGEQRRTNRTLQRQRREETRRLRYTRAYNLQRGIYKIISGAATSGVLFAFFNANVSVEITKIVEEIVVNAGSGPILLTGLPSVLHALWLLGLIPIAKGIAYLINAAFFSKPVEQLLREMEARSPAREIAAAPPTTTLGEGSSDAVQQPPPSISEHTTFHLKTDT